MNSWRFIIGAEENTFDIAISKTFADNLAVKFRVFGDYLTTKRVSDSRHITCEI
jgi:hypothetical protein